VLHKAFAESYSVWATRHLIKGDTKLKRTIRIIPAALFVIFMAISATGRQEAEKNQAAAQPQEIKMTAKTYEFDPAEVRVKAGTDVKLVIVSADKTHGFRLHAVADGADSHAAPGLVLASNEDCAKLKKDEPVTIEFTAKTPGTYSFSCCKFCGTGHGRMHGKIIVEP
jgi:cytochrome c oxidase subunit 2